MRRVNIVSGGRVDVDPRPRQSGDSDQRRREFRKNMSCPITLTLVVVKADRPR
jgi:hypothetical protein